MAKQRPRQAYVGHHFVLRRWLLGMVGVMATTPHQTGRSWEDLHDLGRGRLVNDFNLQPPQSCMSCRRTSVRLTLSWHACTMVLAMPSPSVCFYGDCAPQNLSKWLARFMVDGRVIDLNLLPSSFFIHQKMTRRSWFDFCDLWWMGMMSLFSCGS